MTRALGIDINSPRLSSSGEKTRNISLEFLQAFILKKERKTKKEEEGNKGENPKFEPIQLDLSIIFLTCTDTSLTVA